MKRRNNRSGLVYILGAFVVLLSLACWKYRSNAPLSEGSVGASLGPDPEFAAARSVALAARAHPDPNTAAPTGNSMAAATKSASTQPIATAVAVPLKQASSVLLAPDITSNEWQTLDASKSSGNVAVNVVPAEVPGHPFARQMKLHQNCTNPWDVQITHPLNVALKSGKRIQLSFWARSQDSCPVTAAVEQNVSPYTKAIYQSENLTPEWKEYSESWVQQTDTPDNWAKMDFQFGQKAGVIEITGVAIQQAGGGS